MSKEGYAAGGDKKEGDNKVVLERLQIYLKDKRSIEVPEASTSYTPKPSPSYEPGPVTPNLDDSSNILKEVLNYKKAELLRQPEIVELIKSLSSNTPKPSS